MGGGLATIDELLERACAEGVVPGVVAMVADRDGVMYEGAAGRLRIGEAPPATTDTMFRIASMTKALTSVAALQLVEQGRLALDQTVASVIPAFGALQLLEGFDGDEPRLRELSRQPTIQHLLTHTSGLSYWFSNVDLKKWHDVTGAPSPLTGLRKCLDTPFVAEPGERWEYGVNTAWLGLVVEAVTDQALDEYLAATCLRAARHDRYDLQPHRRAARAADGDPRPHAGRRPRAERHRDCRGAGARIRRRGRIRDGRRLHALPARPAAGRRARRGADPRAGHRLPDVHRPPRAARRCRRSCVPRYRS